MRMLFGLSSGAGPFEDDVDEGEAINFLFDKRKAVVDSEGSLRVPKPEPVDLSDWDCRRMYRARVLEGDLPLVPFSPMLWGPLVSVPDDTPAGGVDAEVTEVEEFVEDVAGVLVSCLLEVVVCEMVEEVAVDVGFDEDVVDAWELRRQ
jgi:hypothetical protein